MSEAKKSRRKSSLGQLHKLYAKRPVVLQQAESSTQTAAGPAPIIDPTMRRYVRKDMMRTVLTAGFFIIVFIVLYQLRNTEAITNAIAWVGSHTGF